MSTETVASIGPDRLDDRPVTWLPAVEPVASPHWRGVEHDCYRAATDAGDRFLTVLTPAARRFVDPAAALDVARAAAALGVGPPVVDADPQAGWTVFAHLPGRWCRAGDVAEPAVFDAAVATLDRLHAGPPLGLPRDVFADAAELVDAAWRELPATWIPDGLAELADTVAAAGRAVHACGVAAVACHRAPEPSNLMLHEGGITLVDFDEAGDADPAHDLAVLLMDAHLWRDWAAGVERAVGRPDPRLLARCRLHAVADHLARGLRALLLGLHSQDRAVEFVKYGQWRLLCCRAVVAGGDLDTWVREARADGGRTDG